MQSYLGTAVAAVAAAVVALSLVEVVHQAIRRLGGWSLLMTELTDHSYRPFQVAATALAVQLAAGPLPWQVVTPRRAARRRPDTDIPDDARVFGGSDDGEARSEAFSGSDDGDLCDGVCVGGTIRPMPAADRYRPGAGSFAPAGRVVVRHRRPFRDIRPRCVCSARCGGPAAHAPASARLRVARTPVVRGRADRPFRAGLTGGDSGHTAR